MAERNSNGLLPGGRASTQGSRGLPDPENMILYEDGLRYEVDDADVELDEGGFWLLAAEGEDFEEFYEFCEDEGDE